jgi:hypothetical protein
MKKTQLIVSICGLVLALQAGASAAWTLADGHYWESYNGKYYALTQTGNGATWEQVRQEALTLGGDLVVIGDTAENSWLESTMFTSPDYQDLPGFDAIDHLWIGLYQTPDAAEPAGGWIWVDDSPVVYSNWAYGGPGNGREVENWAAITDNMDGNEGSWNDYHPTAWLDFGYDGIQGIIERGALPAAAPVPTVPVPGAALLAMIGSACIGLVRRQGR